MSVHTDRDSLRNKLHEILKMLQEATTATRKYFKYKGSFADEAMLYMQTSNNLPIRSSINPCMHASIKADGRTKACTDITYNQTQQHFQAVGQSVMLLHQNEREACKS